MVVLILGYALPQTALLKGITSYLTNQLVPPSIAPQLYYSLAWLGYTYQGRWKK